MAIPGFPDLMLPIFQRVAQRPWKFGELTEAVADQFHLTPDETKALLPSGVQSIIANRTGWAVTNLKRAGLVTNLTRGVWEASDSGRSVLAKDPPGTITMEFLKQFPAFGEHKATPPIKEPLNGTPSPDISPREIIELANRSLKEMLAATLLGEARKISPTAFERLIIDLLVKMGYGGSRDQAGQHLGRSGDGGFDGVIREDSLGLSAIYIQAKRYAADNSVGVPAVQGFVGALVGKGATKGVFVTTSYFTQAALEVAAGSKTYKIVLVDGKELGRLMIEHGIGVATVDTIYIQQVDLEKYSGIDPN